MTATATTSILPQDPDAFCRAKECARYLGIGLSTWWLWVNQGKVKRPIKLGPKTSVWKAGYIREFQRKLIEQANA
ncbi:MULTISPECIES: hypothetical protein [unclassified Microbulbifer]|uniref:helix-turn-helix transcriptional regulator n=1 Tax=unclassified Microbulbifer TaxID=2619833 RepID=UPI0027E498D3|nr:MULTISPECIES: hypothetical protein [unclassified Microbulbifer]